MTVIDTRTGEITEPSAALAVINKSEVSVVTTLENAKRWLATAVEMTGPAEIAAAKAHIATAETYSRELRLSKDIQMDAQEMVRRAEYALARSVRKGQQEGSVRSHGQKSVVHDRWSGVNREATNSTAVSPKEFIPHTEEAHALYAMADNAEPAEFDAALDEARAEGNLSRANVVRKVKQRTTPTTRDARADLIEELAGQGWSSRQMPSKVGVSEETIRKIAREYDIEIPADKAIHRSRRIDWTDVVATTVSGLEDTTEFIRDQIDLSQVDFTEADEWVASLTHSINELRKFTRKIKEATHVV